MSLMSVYQVSTEIRSTKKFTVWTLCLLHTKYGVLSL